MPKLPFIPNRVYHRLNDIHLPFGGNRQSGICPSRNHPYIFIFTGATGEMHGYRDGWDNDDIFSYTGEGQNGDMEFTRGNLALRDHINNGKRVFLFEYVQPAYVKFITEVEFYDVDYFETPDTAGVIRIGIKFFFKRVDAKLKLPNPRILNDFNLLEEPALIYGLENPITERQNLVTSRVGQGAYRKRILHRWEYKCAVTQFDELKILIASHIKPWSVADANERLDVDNGILLSPTFDALFDQHFVSFDQRGKIILSEAIATEAYAKIGVTGQEKILNLTEANQYYLNFHRNVMGV